MLVPLVLAAEKPYFRTATPVPKSFRAPAGAKIVVEWTDGGTTAQLLVRGRVLSRTQADLDIYRGPAPKFVRVGHDRFVVFWTGCATCVAQNYMLLTPSKLSQTRGFETAWAPNFPTDGIVYEYPRHEDPDPRWKTGRKGWLQKKWRWSSLQKRFILIDERNLDQLPPVPAKIFANV